MIYNAYNKGDVIYSENFRNEENWSYPEKGKIIVSKDEEGYSFKLKDEYYLTEVINIKTYKTLGVNEEFLLSFEINSFWPQFKLKINDLVIQSSKHSFGEDVSIELLNDKTSALIYSYDFSHYANSSLSFSLRKGIYDYYFYCNTTLILILPIEPEDFFKKPITVKWFLFTNWIDIKELSLFKLQESNTTGWIEDRSIKSIPSVLSNVSRIDEENKFYHLKRVGSSVKLEIQDKIWGRDYDTKVHWDAFFEVTTNDVFFCMQRRRIAFLSFDLIAEIATYENRICDNPVIMERLRTENESINRYVIAIIGIVRCCELRDILNDLLASRHVRSNQIDNLTNISTEYHKKYIFSELSILENYFDDVVVTNDDILVARSKEGLNSKISLEFEDSELDNFETIISFDLIKTKTLNVFYRDLLLKMDHYSDKSSGILTNDEKVIIPNIQNFITIGVEYLSESKKGKILQTGLPFLYEKYCEIRIQSIKLFDSSLMLFYLNNYLLGSYEKHDFFDYAPSNVISFVSSDSDPYLKFNSLSIKKIVSHDLKLLHTNVFDFKTDELYYISIYRDYDADYEEVFKDRTHIKTILGFSEAEEEIEKYFCLQPEKNREFGYKHYLLTNDFRLINKYRNAVEIHELKKDMQIDTLKWHYISLILNGFCYQSREFSRGGGGIDRYDGRDYSYSYTAGWQISNSVDDW